jgi:hypothetical protein
MAKPLDYAVHQRLQKGKKSRKTPNPQQKRLPTGENKEMLIKDNKLHW